MDGYPMMNEKNPVSDNLSFPAIKAIIFDFGDVLNAPVDYEGVRAHREKLAQQLGLAVDELWPYLFGGSEARAWLTGQITQEAFWNAVLAPKGITDPAEVKQFSDVIFYGAQYLNPEMADLLLDLRGNYQLAVLSNASWTEQELERIFYNDMDLPEGIFSVVVSSTTVGAVKPEAKIYRSALERLQILPEEAVFTDDMPEFAKAAAALGIHAHPFTTPKSFRRFLEKLGVL